MVDPGRGESNDEAGSESTIRSPYGSKWIVYNSNGESLGNIIALHENEHFNIGQATIPLRVNNHRSEDIEIHWVDHERELNPRGTVEPGNQTTLQTFPGHDFVLKCNGEIIDQIHMNRKGVVSNIYNHTVVKDEL